MIEELTAIITFKNEGGEVYKTLKSLENKAKAPYALIVINDNSDDGYEYDYLQNEFKCVYIKHKETIGPAMSRQEGISLCETKYFLILDAHMRVETDGWDLTIKENIENEPNGLYCCITDKLICESNLEIINTESSGYGVSLNLGTLEYKWLNSNSLGDSSLIPCIMGASYCGTKSYWNKIHGLSGLKSYGFEEQFLSIKTYLEGGRCHVIKTVRFAHKFRTSKNVPFKASSALFVYNKLLIIELLYPHGLKLIAFQNIKHQTDSATFDAALKELKENRKFINQEKLYIKKNSPVDFSTVIEINDMFNKIN